MSQKKTFIYPEKLFEVLINNSNLNTDSKILEIGTSNSLASLPLLSLGLDVKSVEINSKKSVQKDNERIQFKNLSFDETEFTTDFYDLIYITKPNEINKSHPAFNKSYNLLNSAGKLAIIEMIPIVNSEAKNFSPIEKELFKEYFNYTLLSEEDDFKISHSEYQKDIFTINNFHIFYTLESYTLDEYVNFIKSFPEFEILTKEVQEGILTKIEKAVVEDSSIEKKITKKHAFVLTVLSKKQKQLSLTFNS